MQRWVHISISEQKPACLKCKNPEYCTIILSGHLQYLHMIRISNIPQRPGGRKPTLSFPRKNNESYQHETWKSYENSKSPKYFWIRLIWFHYQDMANFVISTHLTFSRNVVNLCDCELLESTSHIHELVNTKWTSSYFGTHVKQPYLQIDYLIFF